MVGAYRGSGAGTRQTPQSQRILGREDQSLNEAGGFGWDVDKWERLDRFLILGSEQGTYYVGEQELTRENAEAVQACIDEYGQRVVNRIIEISQSGRAPKNDPAIFALAMALSCSDKDTKLAAGKALPAVCRIGTHLFHFMLYMEQFRGWGRMAKKAVQEWYTNRSYDSLVAQLVKYQQRDGVSHRDMLRLAHPCPEANDPAIAWALGKLSKGSTGLVPPLIQAFEDAKQAEDVTTIVKLIEEHGLQREMIPTQWLTEREVWDALLTEDRMGVTAMVRNLANMTRAGLIEPMSDPLSHICQTLRSEKDISESKIHPIQLLAGLLTYKAGKGFRGKNTWTPVTAVVDALDDAFYLSFQNAPVLEQRVLMGIDISGSMRGSVVNGIPFLSAYEAAAAQALVLMRPAPELVETVAFHTEPVPFTLSPRERLDDAVRTIQDLGTGSTDCSVPIQWAIDHQRRVDAFVILTDSETWAGRKHPAQALVEYREKMNAPKTKLVVVAMCSNTTSIADPQDAGVLNVVGFDTNVPQIIHDFISA